MTKLRKGIRLLMVKSTAATPPFFRTFARLRRMALTEFHCYVVDG